MGDNLLYLSPRRVAVFLSHIRSNDLLRRTLPHEMLLDYVLISPMARTICFAVRLCCC